MSRLDGKTGPASWVPDAEWIRPRDEGDRALGWLFIVLVTALAALVRFYQLGHQNLWVDEIMTWRSVRPDTGLRFWEQIGDAIQGPLYLAVLWPVVRIECNEFLLRLPAALAGVATVPALAVVGRGLFDRPTARLGALLLALSPFHVWYSQEARGYAFLVFFAVTATGVLWSMATRGPGPGRAILFALLSACGVLSNMSYLLLWGGHVLAVILVARPASARDRWLWVAALAGGLLAGLPWLLKASGIWAIGRAVPGAATGEVLREGTTLTPWAPPYAAFAFLYGYSLGPSRADLHGLELLGVVKQHLPILLAAGVVAGVGLVAGLSRLRGRRWVILLWIAVALAGLVFLAWRNIKPFNPRYLAVVFPLVLLLLADGLANLPRWSGRLLTLAFLGLTLLSLGQHYFDDRYAKADVRSAAEWLAENGDPQTPILVPVVTAVFEYYFPGKAKVADSFGTGVLRTEGQARSFLQEKLAGLDEIWVVLARSWFLDPRDRLPGLLAETGEIDTRMQFPGTRVFHWRRFGEGRVEP